jgi:acyl-CoA synthetase (AMP-forming)/AMP-acid ligase II
MASLPQVVHDHASTHPERVAIEVWDEGSGVTLRVSFKQLSDNLKSAAGFLQQVGGVGAGQSCAILSHNTVAYICVSLGLMEIGATAIHLSWRQPDAVNLQLVKELGSKLLLTSRPFAHVAKQAQHEAGVRLMLFESICPTPLESSLPFLRRRRSPRTRSAAITRP